MEPLQWRLTVPQWHTLCSLRARRSESPFIAQTQQLLHVSDERAEETAGRDVAQRRSDKKDQKDLKKKSTVKKKMNSVFF